MSKLRSGKVILTALLLIFLFGWQSALAQDTPQAEATEETAPQSEQQNEPQQEEDLILAETEADEEESPDRFIPTEEISQDLGVSFPVDI